MRHPTVQQIKDEAAAAGVKLARAYTQIERQRWNGANRSPHHARAAAMREFTAALARIFE